MSNINGLPAGTYSVYAHYAGDTVFAASSSAPVTVTITKEASSTNLYPYQLSAAGSLTSTNTFSYGAGEIYLDTEIYPNSGSGTASGSVTFNVSRSGTSLPTLTTQLDTYGTTYLISGPSIANFYLVSNYATLTPGVYTVQANYAGDSSFTASTATTSLTIVRATPSISYSTSTTQVSAGTPVTLNFNIATPAAALPATGSVIFTDTTTSTALGTVSLANGAATLTTSTITTAGAHVITATYSGDSHYTAGTVGSVTITVNAATSTTTTLAASPATVYVGTTVTLAATVSPVPSTGGSVSFYNSGVLLGTAPVSTVSGVATLSVTTFTAGLQTLTANYSGVAATATSNASYGTSTGVGTLLVNKSVTSMRVGAPITRPLARRWHWKVHSPAIHRPPRLRRLHPQVLSASSTVAARAARCLARPHRSSV